MTTYKHADWLALLEERFGKNPLDWAFRCPVCGDVATGEDFSAAIAERYKGSTSGSPKSSDRLGRECIGRSLGVLERPRTGIQDPQQWGGRGCDWTAYGLFSGPDFVETEEGKKLPCFPIAEAKT